MTYIFLSSSQTIKPSTSSYPSTPFLPVVHSHSSSIFFLLTRTYFQLQIIMCTGQTLEGNTLEEMLNPAFHTVNFDKEHATVLVDK